MAFVTTFPDRIDVRRLAGWLPEDQAALESWLAGHRHKAAGQYAPLHPVLAEFQTLIDSDPVVRMYVHQMIAPGAATKPYRKRHLHDVEQMLRLNNTVLTMAPEFGESAVITPLNAILDWTMGTSAGSAAYRDPRIN